MNNFFLWFGIFCTTDESTRTQRVHPKKVMGHAALRSDLRSQKS